MNLTFNNFHRFVTVWCRCLVSYYFLQSTKSSTQETYYLRLVVYCFFAFILIAIQQNNKPFPLTTKRTNVDKEQKGLELDVIVYGEPLPKKKIACGNEII